ncbi:MAG TPA: hypothetical protein VFB84_01590 [Micromonosporaceae bacterium]|nr:hypothetical protein [Micromonosporaceae bacterium]
MPLLLALTIVFFIAAATMGGLALVQKSSSDDTIAKQKTQVTQLERDLAAKTDEATRASADLKTAQGRADDATSRAEGLQEQVDQQAPCRKAVRDFFDAALANNEAAGQKALRAMQLSC